MCPVSFPWDTAHSFPQLWQSQICPDWSSSMYIQIDRGQCLFLEREMATPSSTLAWKNPWIKEPSRLQSMGSQSRTRLSDFTLFHLKSVLIGLTSAMPVVKYGQGKGCPRLRWSGSQKESDGHTTDIELVSLCGMYVFFKYWNTSLRITKQSMVQSLPSIPP